eukprot:TRINITY_DN10845_c0_g1_i1.p1 TRINITY_DN10845_c0_g1~~TRINITY_DN10845_c0_g1_i1.p1  ORF type:complete len:807 (-),score=217.69 TRINITY_DN10845_c0_g1_i1:353-2686(-)
MGAGASSSTHHAVQPVKSLDPHALQSKIDSLQLLNDTLKDMLNEQSDKNATENEKLKADLASERERFQARVIELEILLATERKKHQGRANELLQTYQYDKASFEGKVGELESAIAEERDRTKKRVQEFEDTMECERENYRRKMDTLAASSSTEREQLMSKIGELEKLLAYERSQFQGRVSELIKLLAEDREKNATRMEELQKIEAHEKESLQTRIDELASLLSEQKQRHEAKVADFEKRLNEAADKHQASLENYDTQIRALRSQHEDQLAKLHEQIAASQSRLDDVGVQLQQEREAYERRLTETEIVAAAEKESAQNRLFKLEKVTSERNVLQEQLVEMQRHVEADNVGLQELVELKVLHSAEHDKLADLLAAHNAVLEDRERLQKELVELKMLYEEGQRSLAGSQTVELLATELALAAADDMRIRAEQARAVADDIRIREREQLQLYGTPDAEPTGTLTPQSGSLIPAEPTGFEDASQMQFDVFLAFVESASESARVAFDGRGWQVEKALFTNTPVFELSSIERMVAGSSSLVVFLSEGVFAHHHLIFALKCAVIYGVPLFFIHDVDSCPFFSPTRVPDFLTSWLLEPPIRLAKGYEREAMSRFERRFEAAKAATLARQRSSSDPLPSAVVVFSWLSGLRLANTLSEHLRRDDSVFLLAAKAYEPEDQAELLQAARVVVVLLTADVFDDAEFVKAALNLGTVWSGKLVVVREVLHPVPARIPEVSLSDSTDTKTLAMHAVYQHQHIVTWSDEYPKVAFENFKDALAALPVGDAATA